MPTVPRIQPQVDVRPIPAARRSATLTPLAAGVGVEQAREGIGAALVQAGGAVANATARLTAAQEEAKAKARDRANKLAIVQLQNQADAWRREKVYKPGSGYLAQQGEAALSTPETAQGDLRMFIGDVDPGVTDPDVRLAWERISGDLSDRTMLEVYRHVDGQTREVVKGELSARLENAKSLAIANALDPKRVGVELANGDAAIEALQDYTHFGVTEKAALRAKLRSDVHIGVIRNLLAAEQTERAKAYFDEAHGEIDGESLDDVTNLLRAGSVRADAQKESDRILRAGGTLTEQRDAAKAIKDAETRDATLNYIEHEHQVAKVAEEQAVESRDRSIANILDKTPRYDAIPGSHLMKSAERNHWRAYISNVVESGGQGGGFAKRSDPQVLAKIIDLAQDDPAAFQAFRLTDPGVITRLSKEDWEQAYRGQAGVRKSDMKAYQDALGGKFTFDQMFKAELQAAGIDKDATGVADMQGAIDRDLAVATAALKPGQVLTADEQRAIIRNNLRATLRSGGVFGWFQTVRRGYEATLADVPPAMRSGIVDALRKKGTPVTDATILQTYRNYLASLPGAPK